MPSTCCDAARRRRSQAADHRRRDLEAAGTATRGASSQAAQARPLPRLPARRHAGDSLSPRRRCSCFPRSMKASACRRSRRWPAERRSSPRTCRRCRRSPATRRCSSIPTTSASIADGHAPRADRPGTRRRDAAQGTVARTRVLVGTLGREHVAAVSGDRRTASTSATASRGDVDDSRTPRSGAPPFHEGGTGP